jgi:uncharacterized membrane protein YhaH (DUF805 family)
MNFESLFVNPKGRTSRSQYVPALITLLAVVAFYVILVKGRNGQWCLAVLIFPGTVLLARRLHDMGQNAWMLLAPVALMIAAFMIWLQLVSFGATLDAALPWVALGISAAFALWGCIGKGQAEANSYGPPLAS